MMKALADKNGLKIVSSGRAAKWQGRALIRKGWIDHDPNDQFASEERPSPYYVLTDLGRTIAEILDDEDLVGKPKIGITAAQVAHTLEGLHHRPSWAFVEEVSVGDWGKRRIDALAIKLTMGRRGIWYGPDANFLEIVAYEIKVDRQDFLHEMEDKTKRLPAMEIATRFLFAVTPGVAQASEIPSGCGLIIVGNDGNPSYTVAVNPPKMHTSPPDWKFVASILRAIFRSPKGKH
jgi:hypothetical protein